MTETVEVNPLEQKFTSIVRRVAQECLPGWEEYLGRDKEAATWLGEHYSRMRAAVQDADEVLFERASRKWANGCARINERLAEQYRQSHPDPETWELRIFKWMTKVIYIEFQCELGTFYLVPRRPKKKPRAEYWYTADEMIGMLQPATVAAIKTFEQLPVRPDSLSGPEPNEKHMTLDFTGGTCVIKYACGERKDEGEGLR